jgi:glucose 1-dehydrogenase
MNDSLSQTLTGQVAIISGGLGDIGSAIARELARRGADVAVGDVRGAEDATVLLDSLRQAGRRARYDCVDVADAGAVRDWVQVVEEELGVPTLIIPNAAVVELADFRTVTAEEWNRELQINLSGCFHLAQAAALRLLHHHRPGRVVFTGSWVGHAPQTHIPAYCVSKAGLRMLCRCMALDLAADGIMVNEVAPGNVEAGLSGKLFQQYPERRERSLARIPTHQHLQAEDVAYQVAHLCDPATQHITGSVIVMDGGLSLNS